MSGKPVEIEYLLKDGVSLGLNKIERNATSMGRTVEQEGERIGSMFKRAAAGALAFFSINKAAEYGRSIIQIRGEIQGLALSFETMLGSKAKADRMMADVTEFAMGTPYTVTEVADNVKQLIAMNAAGDDVMETFKALGDVAAGVNVPISRIAINYGQVAALGKLQSREIRDFAMAGIPIVTELAKQFGVAESEIMAMVEAGKIGFPAVQKAFASMAGEGGKFNNMMEKLNSTVTGQLSRLQDAIQQMMNKIGESNEGLIYKAIDGASYLIENYEKIGRILGVLIASYGAYRAALIATVAIQKVSQALEWIRIFNQQTQALTRMTQAQILLTKAVGANPYIKLASILMTVGGLIWAFAKNSGVASEEVSGLGKAMQRANKEFSEQQSKVQALSDIINDGNAAYDARKKAIDDLQEIIPNYNASIGEEGKLINQNTDAIKAYLTQLERQIKMKAAQEELEEAYRQKRRREQELKQVEKDLERANNLSVSSAQTGGAYSAQMQSMALMQVHRLRNELKEVNDDIRELNAEIVSGSDGGVTQVAETVAKKNKEYWEAQKKDAEAALDAMEASVKGGEEWNRQLALLNEATAKLKVWDFGESTKEANQANSILDQREKINQLLDKQTLDRKRTEEDLENQVSQARIHAMRDGFEKTQRQREYDNKLELQSIERQKEDYIRVATEAAKQIFDEQEELKQKQNKNYVKKAFDPETLAVDTAIFDQIIAYVKGKQIKDEQDSARKLIENYGSYLEKRAALAEEWEKKIAELPEKYRDGARQKMVADLAAIDNEYQVFSDGLDSLFSRSSTRSISELQRILDKAKEIQTALKNGDYDAYVGAEGNSKNRMTREQFDVFRNSPQQMKDLGDRVDDTTRKVFQTQNAFKRLGQAIKEAIDPKGDKKQAFADIGSALGEISGLASSVGDSVGQIFSTLGDDAAAEAVGTLTDMISGVGELGAGIASLASGDIIGGIQGVFSGLAKITSLFKDNEQQLRAAEEAARGYDAALKEIARTKRYDLFDTIFGTDGVGKFQEAKDIVDESLRDIKKQADDIQNRKRKFFGMVMDDPIVATFDGRSKWNKLWGTGGHKIKNYVFDINDYINSDGSLKLEELQKWYDNYEKGLDSSEKQRLQELIANGEAYEEAIQVMTDHIGQLWGDLASSIADNMIDAFLETGDAAKNLGNLVDDVARNMAKSLIESLLITGDPELGIEGIFNDNLQKKLLDLLKIDDQDGANKLIQDAIASAGELAPIIEGIITSLGLTSEAAEKGVTQHGKAGAFQTMSQDTGTELKGLFTAMRMSMDDMKVSIDNIGPGLSEATGVLVEIREEVKKSNNWLGKIFDRIEVIWRDGLKTQ